MFIFQKQLSQQKQLEEVNAAGAIRTLRDAVKSAVALQRDDLVTYPEGVTLKDASEFLPQEYFSGFRVAVRREGAKLSAIIVSPTSLGRYALDNLSAARISSMLGASGGFVPSLTDEPSSTANGTLGLWSLDMASIVPDIAAADISNAAAAPVRIVVNIEFSEEAAGLPAEEKGKLLYRTADYGQASNTMITSLFFSDGSADTIILDPALGKLIAKTAEFSGALSAGGGKFSVDADGNVNGGTGSFSGALTAASADFGSGAVKGGDFSGATGTFTGAVTSGGLAQMLPDGSFTNGQFTIHPSGAIVSNSTLSAAGGKFEVGAGGGFSAADGKFVVSDTGAFGGPKFAVGEDGAFGADGFYTDAAGNLIMAGLIKGLAAASAGSPCNGGFLASSGTDTLICKGGNWVFAGGNGEYGDWIEDQVTKRTLPQICSLMQAHSISDLQLINPACGENTGATPASICTLLINKQVLHRDLFDVACGRHGVCDLLFSYNITAPAIMNMACTSQSAAKQQQICDWIIANGHSAKADLTSAACGENNLCAYAIAQGSAIDASVWLTSGPGMQGQKRGPGEPVNINGQFCGYKPDSYVAGTSWWLYTASSGTFRAPVSGTYYIRVIGGGGGGAYYAGGGGGSTAFYGGGITAVIGGGGGGGAGIWAAGASGTVVNSGSVSLVKGTAYTVRVGQGGQVGTTSSNTSVAGGAGYTAGKATSITVANARGCLNTNYFYCGGDGGSYNSTSVHGGDYNTSFLGGAGGRSSGANYNSTTDTPGGAGYSFSVATGTGTITVGPFGAGGHGYYYPGGSQTAGSPGAVWIRLNAQ
ncbi:hypothetical protein FACS1894186_0240 [Alphaproteobacteria bacterium]|nr:hypothetical protein FACS1894186_0240 [Alphaproteobacteria bacterium]